MLENPKSNEFQIRGQVSILEDEIVGLYKIADELKSKLQPVMGSDLPIRGSEPVRESLDLCPLSVEIYSLKMRVVTLQDKLNNILYRLQV